MEKVSNMFQTLTRFMDCWGVSSVGAWWYYTKVWCGVTCAEYLHCCYIPTRLKNIKGGGWGWGGGAYYKYAYVWTLFWST